MNITDLTLGEIEEVENYAGMPVSELANPETSNTKLLIGMAFVANRRENPKYKLEDAKKLTMEEVTALLMVDEDPKE